MRCSYIVPSPPILFPLTHICLCMWLLLSKAVAVLIVMTVIHHNSGNKNSCEKNHSAAGLPHTPEPFPQHVVSMKACAVYCCTSLLVGFYFSLLVLSFPSTVGILAWTGWIRVLWFCFRHMALPSKVFRKTLGRVWGGELDMEAIVSVISLSCPSFLDVNCCCLNLFSFLTLSLCKDWVHYWVWEAESDINPLPSCCGVKAPGEMAFVWLLQKSSQWLPGESGCKWNPYAMLLSAKNCWKSL